MLRSRKWKTNIAEANSDWVQLAPAADCIFFQSKTFCTPPTAVHRLGIWQQSKIKNNRICFNMSSAVLILQHCSYCSSVSHHFLQPMLNPLNRWLPNNRLSNLFPTSPFAKLSAESKFSWSRRLSSAFVCIGATVPGGGNKHFCQDMFPFALSYTSVYGWLGFALLWPLAFCPTKSLQSSILDSTSVSPTRFLVFVGEAGGIGECWDGGWPFWNISKKM